MSGQLTVDLIAIEPTPAVVLAPRATGPDLVPALEAGVLRLQRAIAAAHLPTAGPPFVRYLSTAEPYEIEVGVSVDQPQSAPGLRATILPGGTAASVTHSGDIARVPRLLEELADWVDSRHASVGQPWQWHWTVPGQQPGRIQIVWPVEL